MRCPDCGEVMQNGVCPRCGYGVPKEETVPGVGPDAPVMVNEHGGRQSVTPYRFDLIPPKTLLELASIFGYGASKHGDNNWRKLTIEEILCHVVQHIEAWRAGDRSDKHLSHALCRICMAVAQEIEPTEDTPNA